MVNFVMLSKENEVLISRPTLVIQGIKKRIFELLKV